MIILKDIWENMGQNKVQLTEREQRARERVYLALDGISYVNDAVDLAKELVHYVGAVKVGKELHTLAGNHGRNIVEELKKNGMNSFLDLKFHDTPNTVYRASLESAVPGVNMFNLHIAGGEKMCKRAVDGAYDGAEKRRMEERPKVIGVTVLTSLDDNDLITQGLGTGYDDLVRRRTELAREWGLDGVVCPANKAGRLEREFG